MFLKSFFIVFFTLFFCMGEAVFSDNNQMMHTASHAPIGVMGDHVHKQGEMMVSYRFMNMRMKGMLLGDKKKERSETPYSMYADEMEMQMHMLGVMWAFSDDYTLMLMANWLSNDMDMVSSGVSCMGLSCPSPAITMSDDTYGLSSISISAIQHFLSFSEFDLIVSNGLSIPTGKTDIKRNNMMGQSEYVGYPMQIGSGSVSLLHKITAKTFVDSFSFGGQYALDIPLGNNDSGYREGASVLTTAWASYSFSQNVSSSLRLSYDTQGELQEKRSFSAMSALDNPLQAPYKGGYRMWRLALGLNTLITDGFLDGYRFNVEYEIPLSQYVVHYQMKEVSRFSLGIQKAF